MDWSQLAQELPFKHVTAGHIDGRAEGRDRTTRKKT
jgi:hypothetical protein